MRSKLFSFLIDFLAPPTSYYNRTTYSHFSFFVMAIAGLNRQLGRRGQAGDLEQEFLQGLPCLPTQLSLLI